MKTILGLSLIIIFTGCAKHLDVAPEFQGIVTEFNLEATKQSRSAAENLIIEFGETSNQYAGATCYSNNGTPRITVNKMTWDAFSDQSRKEMIFHEMGHCVLNREHTTDRYTEDNCPKSIMHKSPVGEWCENAHSLDYQTELFSK